MELKGYDYTEVLLECFSIPRDIGKVITKIVNYHRLRLIKYIEKIKKIPPFNQSFFIVNIDSHCVRVESLHPTEIKDTDIYDTLVDLFGLTWDDLTYKYNQINKTCPYKDLNLLYALCYKVDCYFKSKYVKMKYSDWEEKFCPLLLEIFMERLIEDSALSIQGKLVLSLFSNDKKEDSKYILKDILIPNAKLTKELTSLMTPEQLWNLLDECLTGKESIDNPKQLDFVSSYLGLSSH